jgi:hypothetical protein
MVRCYGGRPRHQETEHRSLPRELLASDLVVGAVSRGSITSSCVRRWQKNEQLYGNMPAEIRKVVRVLCPWGWGLSLVTGVDFDLNITTLLCVTLCLNHDVNNDTKQARKIALTRSMSLMHIQGRYPWHKCNLSSFTHLELIYDSFAVV